MVNPSLCGPLCTGGEGSAADAKLSLHVGEMLSAKELGILKRCGGVRGTIFLVAQERGNRPGSVGSS
jgi:hypothetical protein